MPIGFLSDTERERLDNFPAQIIPSDLETYFTLTRVDRKQVSRTTSAANRTEMDYTLCPGPPSRGVSSPKNCEDLRECLPGPNRPGVPESWSWPRMPWRS